MAEALARYDEMNSTPLGRMTLDRDHYYSQAQRLHAELSEARRRIDDLNDENLRLVGEAGYMAEEIMRLRGEEGEQ